MTDAERIAELESKLASCQQIVEAQKSVVVAAEFRATTLQAKLAAAEARIKEMTEIGIEIQNERLAEYERAGAELPEKPSSFLWPQIGYAPVDIHGPRFVRQSDYDALRAVAVALKAENDRLTAALATARQEERERPRIVCLCGSTRFKAAFEEANYQETMAGRIVLSVGFYMHASGNKHWEGIGATPEQKTALDVLHKQKIDLADEVLVLNVGGYIGDSTRSEIEHAIGKNKPIRFLEWDPKYCVETAAVWREHS